MSKADSLKALGQVTTVLSNGTVIGNCTRVINHHTQSTLSY